MLKKFLVVVAVLAASTSEAQLTDDPIVLLRGDANLDDSVDVSDVATISSWLYSGGAAPPCLNQADVNNDGAVDTSDPIYLANFLFSGGTPPPAPGWNESTCVFDDEPYPGCEESPCS